MAIKSSGAGVKHRRREGSLPLLPVPPGEAEKASYSDRNIALILRASLFSFGALLISQARFIITAPPLLIFAPLLAFTVVYYLISLFVNVGTRGFDMAAHRALVNAWHPVPYPSLDIFLPVCGEPVEILHNTWRYVAELVRCYPGAATAYVLDDAESSQAAALAEAFGFMYLVRPNRGWYKKAGNLRHAFTRSSGEFILILDADFTPRADLPLEMLPYFGADPTLGIVQSPQYFRTHARQSWIERGAGAVQELFYRMVQVSRDRHQGAICVGSCAIYRRVALESNGGTTLIEHSEDVHTGFDLRRAGWNLRYLPIPLATGLCPPDPDSFLTQQYRWCAGSMSLLASRKFWTTKMRLRTRFCYLSGFCYYLHTALFTFVAPAHTADHAHLHARARPAHQLRVHRAVNPLQHGRLPVLAPLPLRALGLHGQVPLRLGAPVLPVRHLPRPADGLAGDGNRPAQDRNPAGVDRDGPVEHPHLLRVGAARGVADAALRLRELRGHPGHRRVRQHHHRHGHRVTP